MGDGKVHLKIRGNNCTISMGKNNSIERGVLFLNAFNYNGRNCEGSCFIGDSNRFRGGIHICLPLLRDKKVQIGNKNLFAANSEIIGCTEHPVYNIDTGEMINEEQNVIIGDNNWIGRDALFLCKGGIESNSVVGIRSTVTKKFTESNVIIAGTPAVIKRRSIEWYDGFSRP